MHTSIYVIMPRKGAGLQVTGTWRSLQLPRERAKSLGHKLVSVFLKTEFALRRTGPTASAYCGVLAAAVSTCLKSGCRSSTMIDGHWSRHNAASEVLFSEILSHRQNVRLMIKVEASGFENFHSYTRSFRKPRIQKMVFKV